jgi:Domain of Unknown Function with PDB structure (DUF3857)
MKKLILNIIVLFLSIQIFAQNTEELKVKFGKISDAEIKMKSYEKDPTAPAVVLFDKASLDYEYDEKKFFRGSYYRHARIKIFKKEAYSFANIQLLYKTTGFDMQRISDIKAVCYNFENGKMVETKLTDENIFDEKLTKRISVKKLSIPGVKEGSIIEFRYKFNYDGIEAPDWQFQEEIPVVWSEFEAEIPEFFVFLPIIEGATPYLVNTKKINVRNKTINMTVTESGYTNQKSTGTAQFNWKTTAYRWVQKDIPALKTEKYMTSAKDYLTKVYFQAKGYYHSSFNGLIAGPNGTSTATLTAGSFEPIYSSWGKVAEDLMEEERFGGVIENKSETKEEVSKIIKGITTPKDKMNAIYGFIGKNYEIIDRNSIFMTQSLSDLLKSHKGSATDVNLMLINMLRVAGLNASPVIISTRKNGQISHIYPILHKVNKVIVQVKLSETDSIIVDVSGYPQPMNLLPFEDLNGEGFAIYDKKTTNWIPIKNSMMNKKFYAANFALNTEGVLSGDINYTFTGYSAIENRLAIKDDGSDKHMKQLVKGMINDGKMESYKFENIEPLSDLPLKGTVKLSTSSCITKSNEKIYISPLVCMVEKENPFKAEDRKYNVDYGEPRDEFYQVNIKMPDGYKVEELPKTSRIQLPEGAIKFEYLISLKDNLVTINAKFNIKRSIFTADEYKDLKQVYTQILAKMSEQIVLIKETK